MTPAMVERCEQSIALSGFTNAEVHSGDAEDLPFPDASFDAVSTNGALNLVPDKARALHEIHRVLRPGGQLVLGDIVVTSGAGRFMRNNVNLWALCVGGAVREQELLTLVGEAGFANGQITHRFACTQGGNGDVFARWLGIHGVNLHSTKPS